VAIIVIDRPETVEIKHANSEQGFVASGHGNRHGQPVVEQGSVGQAGQRVKVRQFLQSLLVLFLNCDVGENPNVVAQFACAVKDSRNG
jgi:hypothetical protein